MNRLFRTMMVTMSCFICAAVAAQTTTEQQSGEPSPSAPTPMAASPAPATAPPASAQVGPYAVGPQLYVEQVPRADLVQARLAEREARYQERLKREEEARRSGRPLIVSGAVLLGVGYMISLTVGSVIMDVADNRAGYMLVPIVGNPIYLSMVLRDMNEDDIDDDYDDDEPRFLVSMALLTPAIAQLTGAILLTTGLVKHSRYKKEKAHYALVPTVTANTRGLSFAMTF